MSGTIFQDIGYVSQPNDEHDLSQGIKNAFIRLWTAHGGLIQGKALRRERLVRLTQDLAFKLLSRQPTLVENHISNEYDDCRRV